MEQHMPYLHLLQSNSYDRKVYALLASNYYQDETIDGVDFSKLKSLLENMEEPDMLGDWIHRRKEAIQPILFHFKQLILEGLPTDLNERQKFEAAYISAVKESRFEEVTLIKLKKCLEQGQIQRFLKLSKELSVKKVSQCPKMIEGCINLRSYLERINRVHQEGISLAQDKSRRRINFNVQDKRLDWTYPLMAAAYMDADNCSELFENLLERLQQEYDQDLHRLTLALASVLAKRDSMSPMTLGLHVLPEELVLFLKSNPNAVQLKVCFEKVAGMLDSPNGATMDTWLLLRIVILQVLRLEKVEIATEIFRDTFDPMRVKAWLKMHFQVNSLDYSVFRKKLWQKISMGNDNPANKEYKSLYKKIMSKCKYQEATSKKELKTSSLELSRRYAKVQLNYHELIYKSVNLPRDVGLLHVFSDELLKFHVVLRYIEDNDHIPQSENTNSTTFRFSNENFALALKIMRSEVRLPELTSDNKTSSINMIYEENPQAVMKHVSEELNVTNKAHLKILENIITLKWRANLKEKVNKATSLRTIYAHLMKLRWRLNFKPFQKRLLEIKSSYLEDSAQWSIPKIVLRNATEEIESLVLTRPTTILIAVQNVCAKEEFSDHSVNLEEFFDNKFDDLLHFTTINLFS